MANKSALRVVQAKKAKLVQETGFHNYDYCLNPYVGCQFGCSFCYVRFFIKDQQSAWGDFVRVRGFLRERLPNEFSTLAGKRLVIGTMTDPYMPIERKFRITRTALKLIATAPTSKKPTKVGIFTRSPVILDDEALIASLPAPEIHMSITPYPRELAKKIETMPVVNDAKYRIAARFVQAKVRICINVAPAIPYVSDRETELHARCIAESGASEFYVDPMQAYRESYEQLRTALAQDPIWPKVDATMTNKKAFQAWKDEYRNAWRTAWAKYGRPEVLAIWCDHVNKVRERLEDGTAV
jgi:DNA repair photolyase